MRQKTKKLNNNQSVVFLMGLGDYTVLDIETTGLSRYQHRITEIAAARYRSGRRVKEFQTLVNPEVPIPWFIRRLTGISSAMVADAPKIQKALPEFLDFLGPSVIVAHNASFDHGFISHNAKEHLGMELNNHTLCTKKLANRLLPDLPSKRLAALCELFRIENERAHRAMGDVNATAQVFSRLLALLRRQRIMTEKQILDFERGPRRQVYRSLSSTRISVRPRA